MENFILEVEGFLKAIDWPNILVGALLPFMAAALLALYEFVKLFRHHPLGRLVGKYELIHWSGTQHAVRRKRLTISRRLMSGFVAKLEPHPVIPLDYFGAVKIGSGQIFNINLSSKKHPGQLNLSFPMPLTENFSVVKGVFSSTTLNYEPFAGVVLLAKLGLPDNDVEALLGARRLIRVPKSHLSIESDENAIEAVKKTE